MLKAYILVPLAIIVPIATVYLMQALSGDLFSAVFLGFIFLTTVMALFPTGLRQEERERRGHR